MIYRTFLSVALMTGACAIAGAEAPDLSSREWSVTGPDGLTYDLNRTVTADEPGPFLVLIVNFPADAPELPEPERAAFVDSLLETECRKLGGAPSVARIEESSREPKVNRYVWKGQRRTSLSVVRHCL